MTLVGRFQRRKNMVTWFYFIVFVLSLIFALKCLLQNKNIDTLFVLCFVAIIINCAGRYLLATSEGLEMAIWANKFLYVGGVYAPLLSVFVLARLCNIKMPKLLSDLLVLYSTIVLGLVMTIGKYDIYYRSVELAKGDGYNYLIKAYGPLHFFYPVMMMVYALIMIIFMYLAFQRRRYISFRIVIIVSVTCFSIIFLYIIERVMEMKISVLAVGYLIGLFLLIKYFNHLNMYDMSSNVVTTVEKMKEYGYIVFDNKYDFINANTVIRNMFPEINLWEVDRVVKPSDSFLYNEVVKYLVEYDGKEENSKIINVEDSFFELNIREINYGKKGKVGYLLEFTDRTIEQRYYRTIEEYNTNLENEVNEKTAHILHIKDMMVLGMADMVENRDNNTGGHIKRTSEVVKIFAGKLMKHCNQFDFDNTFLSQVAKAAPMHDLGKISIEDAVLRKPGKFTDEEFAKMKRHTTEGARIVESLLQGVEDDDFVQIAQNVAHYHHEKWNGKGYPRGISGKDIPIEARIMALADVFDALVSKRCYKEAFSYEKAYEIIEESLGTHFDPELGRIFLACKKELEQLYESMS